VLDSAVPSAWLANCVRIGMKKKLIVFTLALSIVALYRLPPIHQSQNYHHFANQTEYGEIPNFWNIISNVGFLLVAAAGWPRQIARWREPWRRACFQTLLIGTALTAFGSAYYHAQPSDTRLVWDRLPMTIVFMCVLTFTIEEQLDPLLARRLFVPLLTVGLLSVIYWRFSGDLRPYILVQFYPLILIPVLLCFSKREGVTSLGPAKQ
jgi:phosphoglycerol transferase MdoB-like AlkP superfamily enzyme